MTRPIDMETNKEFAILVGRAFLREVETGDIESAVAFGRAFLISLGMKGPDEIDRTSHNGRPDSEHLASVAN